MPCIYTAKYLLPGDAPLIIDGALLELDGRIVESGTLAGVRRGNEQVQVVDFAEAVMLPPMVNAHTHLELTDYPRWAEQCGETLDAKSFVDWILQVIRVKHALPKESYLPSINRGLQMSLAAGTGVVGDILSQFQVRDAYHFSPLRGRVYLEALGQDTEFIQKSMQKIDAILEENDLGTMAPGLSPHSPYTLSSEYLSLIYDKCRHQDLFCSTHTAESADEVEFLQNHGGEIGERLYPYVGWQDKLGKPPGSSSVDYLQARGGLHARNLLVHAVQLTRDDITKVAIAGCPVALCPRSNARLDVGIAPLAELLSAGVTLALGTDSLASCDSLSIWDEMAFAKGWFAGQVDAPTLLRMATLGGAEALGLNRELGSLQADYRCSFQVLRPEVLPNETEIHEFLTSEGRSQEVEQLCLDGTLILSGSS